MNVDSRTAETGLSSAPLVETEPLGESLSRTGLLTGASMETGSPAEAAATAEPGILEVAGWRVPIRWFADHCCALTERLVPNKATLVPFILDCAEYFEQNPDPLDLFLQQVNNEKAPGARRLSPVFPYLPAHATCKIPATAAEFVNKLRSTIDAFEEGITKLRELDEEATNLLVKYEAAHMELYREQLLWNCSHSRAIKHGLGSAPSSGTDSPTGRRRDSRPEAAGILHSNDPKQTSEQDNRVGSSVGSNSSQRYVQHFDVEPWPTPMLDRFEVLGQLSDDLVIVERSQSKLITDIDTLVAGDLGSIVTLLARYLISQEKDVPLQLITSSLQPHPSLFQTCSGSETCGLSQLAAEQIKNDGSVSPPMIRLPAAVIEASSPALLDDVPFVKAT